MKGYIVCFLMVFGIQLFARDFPSSSGIDWMTDYKEAVKASEESNKPMLLFFTGSDWCVWCQKLESESLDTPEFIKTVGDKLIFVKLDFPSRGQQSPEVVKQNDELRSRFAIRGYPTLILVSPKEQQIGITGYRPGGGKAYADHLLKMMNEYSDYSQKMGSLNNPSTSGKELKRLYQKSQELGLTADSELLIERGIHSDLPHFFLAERYRRLVVQGKSEDKSTQELKQKLLNSDPANLNLIHYQVAVIDFQDNCEKMCHGQCSPDTCVAPLVTYLQEFGSKDEQNEWRLNMIVSQTFLDQNRPKEALQFAEAALKVAPVSVQQEIAEGINNIKAQLHTTQQTQ